MLFYFTGTGNSQYVAQKIAEALGDRVYSMAAYELEGRIGGKGERIGFAFPSYYGHLSRIVKNFISRLDIRPDTYIFGVVTMGGAGLGSITMLEKALAEKKLTLSYPKLPEIIAW